ncbi:MAG TPA: CPBP family intramembrane glutamic endopeptidase [Nakamurella sp.]
MTAPPPASADRPARSLASGAWRPAPSGAGPVVRAAWVVVVLVGTAPAIVWDQLTGAVPSWLPVAQAGLLALALLAPAWWPVLRPLRRFTVIIAAMLALLTWVPRFGANRPVFGGSAFDVRMQAEQTGRLVVALAMIGVLFLLGYRRRDFFLTVGDLRAPIRPVRFLGFPGRDPWWKFGLIWSGGIAAALGVALYLSDPPGGGLATLVGLLPSVLIYAALNAFTEEMTYRAPMLAGLEPAVGSNQALWLAAVFFGIAHYFGTPGGLIGAALSVFMGWILGKAMIETRGLFWPWWIHFLSDTVIFTFVALSLVG